MAKPTTEDLAEKMAELSEKIRSAITRDDWRTHGLLRKEYETVRRRWERSLTTEHN